MASVLIAITCADDSVALMSYVTNDGNGQDRMADAGAIELEVQKVAREQFAPEQVPIKYWHPVDRADVPPDRTHRDKLRHHPDHGFSHAPDA